MNEGMGYKYNAIIKPIIAETYLTLSKLVWKKGIKKDTIVYLFKVLLTNPKILIKWVVTKNILIS